MLRSAQDIIAIAATRGAAQGPERQGGGGGDRGRFWTIPNGRVVQADAGWYLIGLVLGVWRLLAGLAPAGHAVGAAVLPVGLLLLLVLAAKRATIRPSLQAAFVALCYVVPAGLVKVLCAAKGPSGHNISMALENRLSS